MRGRISVTARTRGSRPVTASPLQYADDSRGMSSSAPTGAVYKEVADKPPVINLIDDPRTEGRPFMPVEFAVATYRPQHPGPFYVLNDTGAVKRPE